MVHTAYKESSKIGRAFPSLESTLVNVGFYVVNRQANGLTITRRSIFGHHLGTYVEEFSAPNADASCIIGKGDSNGTVRDLRWKVCKL